MIPGAEDSLEAGEVDVFDGRRMPSRKGTP